jgi:8-oxo-dGTP pyrophosphatase MutT (NUDIX family)
LVFHLYVIYGRNFIFAVVATGNANFIQLLKRELSLPLPGKRIQYLMAPADRDSRRFDFPENQTPRLSSVMILLYHENGHWKFPLILRPNYSGVHSGQMALPGGRMEEVDRDSIETAIRETREETGIDTEGLEIVGNLTELDVRASHNIVLPVVGYYPGIPGFKPDPAEVESLHQVSLDEILNEKNRKMTTIPVNEKYHIEAPYYDVEGKIVWGATAMILAEFLYIVKNIITI